MATAQPAADDLALQSRTLQRVALPAPPSIGDAEASLSQAQRNLETICGLYDDAQHVEAYFGTNPATEFVRHEEPSTVQFQWHEDLSSVTGQRGSPGNVPGKRWCTGTLISADLVLTAGHCFAIYEAGNPTGWVTPRSENSYLEPRQLAKLMNVHFNYQVNRETRKLRTPDTYSVLDLLEIGADRPNSDGTLLDYAIVRLASRPDGAPGVRYAAANYDTSRDALVGAKRVTIIQHPNGDPKKVDVGDLMDERDHLLRYNDVDTRRGSSGAGIIDQNGALVGVHTEGGCAAYTGNNSGVSLHAISEVSDIIR